MVRVHLEVGLRVHVGDGAALVLEKLRHLVRVRARGRARARHASHGARLQP